MKKRIVALLLVLIFAFSCLTGCGDKDDKEKKKKAKSYDDIYDMLEAMSDFKEGTATLSCDIDLGQKGVAKITATVVNDGKNNYAISLAVDADTEEVKLNASVDDIAIVKDDMLYLNLGGVVKALTSVEPEIGEMLGDTKLNYFAVPLPDDFDYSEISTVVADWMGIYTKFLKKGLADAEVEGEKDEFSVAFKDAKAYKTFISAAADFMEGDVADYIAKKSESLTKSNVDLNKYAEKLINYYYDDVVELAGALGATKDQIDAMVAEIKGMDLNSKLGELIEEEAGDLDSESIKRELKEAAEELRKRTEELSDEDLSNIKTEFTVKTTDAGFKMRATVDGTVKGESAKFDITMKISDEYDKISAPSDLTRLRDFKDILSMIGPMLSGRLDF